jgi:drug/metabolite transporter (DMT)-like permease
MRLAFAYLEAIGFALILAGLALWYIADFHNQTSPLSSILGIVGGLLALVGVAVYYTFRGKDPRLR